jgi:hexosaminidase
VTPPALVPLPADAVFPDAAPGFRLASAAASGDEAAAERFVRSTRARTGLDLPMSANGAIRFALESGPAESYRIRIDADAVEVTGADAAGLFYAAHTLAQVLTLDADGWMLPAAVIRDAPRFSYRGAMLDVARHFFDADVVCRYLERISALKLNHLHLHLTDDQGWRIQIPARPELTERAAAGAALGDAGGFFTVEDYARIVAHAAAHHVTVVPEIDLPSHTHAVGLAYPEIAVDPVITDGVRAAAALTDGALPTRGEPYTGWAVGFSSLRTDDERTYEFVADVFGDLARMTPGPYLHIGGDEALGTTPEQYAHFVRRAVALAAATGKRPIAWQEAGRVEGLAVPLVAQYWGFASAPATGEAAESLGDAREAARAVVAAGGSVILSPADVAYLDMKPDAASALGLTWANGPTPLRAAYEWEPAEVVGGIEEASILGVEAPLWTETVRSADDIDALAFPRIAAVAEIAWSPRTGPGRTWESFRGRVAGLRPTWAAAGIAAGPAPDGEGRDR